MTHLHRRIYVGLDAAAMILIIAGAAVLFSTPFQLAKLPKAAKLPAIPFVSLAIKPLPAMLEDLKTHALFFIPPPPLVEAQVVPANDSVFLNYRVIGIVLGARPAAVVEEAPQKKTHLVAPGEFFNGIKVLDILSKSVLMEFQGYQKVLPLSELPA